MFLGGYCYAFPITSSPTIESAKLTSFFRLSSDLDLFMLDRTPDSFFYILPSSSFLMFTVRYSVFYGSITYRTNVASPSLGSDIKFQKYKQT
jgi:hypothetical protein